MQYVHLGRSGVVVSRLCLGTWNFGWHVDEPECHRILDMSLEHGINFIDSANSYGRRPGEGWTEQILGRWIAKGGGRREKVVLGTKVYGRMSDWPNDRRLSARHIRDACDASLRRLQTDHLDLYQMHHVDRETPWEEIWTAMDLLVQQGKVIYVGSSNFAAWDIVEAQQSASARHMLGLVSEQPRYNLLGRLVEAELLPACAKLGIGILPWGSHEGGALAGILGKEEGVGRSASDEAQRDLREHRVQIEAFEALCAQIGEEPANVAIAWLLAQPGVTAPIIGPRTEAQLFGSLRAVEIQLSPETLTRLDDLFPGPGVAPDPYMTYH